MLTITNKLAMAEDYNGGLSLSLVGKKYGVTQQTMSYHFKRMGVPIKTHSEGKRIYTLDQGAFDRITEESAYWTGILMADGSVIHDEGHAPLIHLGFKRSDEGHLLKFKSFLKSSHPIFRRDMRHGKSHPERLHPFSSVSIRSWKLTEALEKLGVIPDKTKRTKAVAELANDRHFWRGVADGDGCVSSYLSNGGRNRYPQFTLLGSESLMNQFSRFVFESCGALPKVSFRSGIFSVHLTCSKAASIIRTLYENASVFLDRKQVLADRIIKEAA